MELEELIELEPEEIGWVLLNNLRNNMPQVYSNGQSHDSRTVQFHNAASGLDPTRVQDQRETNRIRAEHSRVLIEGWQWLEHEGLIAVDPIQNDSDFKIITRRGLSISSREELIDITATRLLPQTLHAEILVVSRPLFIRKDYETAVMHAFRSVEIAVRSNGGFAESNVGVSLMRDAFRPVSDTTATKPVGPLTDIHAEPGEQSGMVSLFVGSVACFRNPSAHRHVNIDKDEAVELLGFASRLLKIVDRQSSLSQT